MDVFFRLKVFDYTVNDENVLHAIDLFIEKGI